jgi:hypothetical protein
MLNDKNTMENTTPPFPTAFQVRIVSDKKTSRFSINEKPYKRG